MQLYQAQWDSRSLYNYISLFKIPPVGNFKIHWHYKAISVWLVCWFLFWFGFFNKYNWSPSPFHFFYTFTQVKLKSPWALYSARPCYTPWTPIIAIHKITGDCQKLEQINSENVVGWFPKLHKINRLTVQPKYHRKIIGKATWGEVIIIKYESYAIMAYLMRTPEI